MKAGTKVRLVDDHVWLGVVEERYTGWKVGMKGKYKVIWEDGSWSWEDRNDIEPIED